MPKDTDLKELPFETLERVTGHKWEGGKGTLIRLMLKLAGIKAAPGSAEANLQLQSLVEGHEAEERAQAWAHSATGTRYRAAAAPSSGAGPSELRIRAYELLAAFLGQASFADVTDEFLESLLAKGREYEAAGDETSLYVSEALALEIKRRQAIR
jgi:hypothetical protein